MYFLEIPVFVCVQWVSTNKTPQKGIRQQNGAWFTDTKKVKLSIFVLLDNFFLLDILLIIIVRTPFLPPYKKLR